MNHGCVLVQSFADVCVFLYTYIYICIILIYMYIIFRLFHWFSIIMDIRLVKYSDFTLTIRWSLVQIAGERAALTFFAHAPMCWLYAQKISCRLVWWCTRYCHFNKRVFLSTLTKLKKIWQRLNDSWRLFWQSWHLQFFSAYNSVCWLYIQKIWRGLIRWCLRYCHFNKRVFCSTDTNLKN